MLDTLPPIAITPGEPAGIGPDLLIRLVQQPLPAAPVAIADPTLLEARAAELGLPLKLVPFTAGAPATHVPGTLKVLPVELAVPCVTGQADPRNGGYVLETLRQAVAGCLKDDFSALVTGPVHKGVINEAGFPFTGHTEFLAELTQTPKVVMMLATTDLRVALATTHLPLRKVSEAITPDHLREVIRILHRELMAKFAIDAPRILVCGLNPHAGESGHLGDEEIKIIEPVLGELREEGLNLIGPVPADTAFTPQRLAEADAVLTMYHDQGLPVLKHLGFGRAFNITLGLPILRISVDHGTALELAGSGKADSGSLEAALGLAFDILRQGETRRKTA